MSNELVLREKRELETIAEDRGDKIRKLQARMGLRENAWVVDICFVALPLAGLVNFLLYGTVIKSEVLSCLVSLGATTAGLAAKHLIGTWLNRRASKKVESLAADRREAEKRLNAMTARERIAEQIRRLEEEIRYQATESDRVKTENEQQLAKLRAELDKLRDSPYRE